MPETTHTNTPDLLLAVEGMNCEHCEAAVTAEVSRVSGVTGVRVDLATGRVRVQGEGIDTASVVAAVDEAGYDAEPVS